MFLYIYGVPDVAVRVETSLGYLGLFCKPIQIIVALYQSLKIKYTK